jgi:hypothetical protein
MMRLERFSVLRHTIASARILDRRESTGEICRLYVREAEVKDGGGLAYYDKVTALNCRPQSSINAAI